MATKNYDVIREQIRTTISNIEHDTVTREDRVFLTHVLEEIQGKLDPMEDPEFWGYAVIGRSFEDLVGSTQELVEDGLVQADEN
jgi:transcriptional regulator NrdR family protein